jgi:hypothetical protein
LKLHWENSGCITTLDANLKDYSFNITGTDEKGMVMKMEY